MEAKDPLNSYPNILSLYEIVGSNRGAMDDMAQYHYASLSVLEGALTTLDMAMRPSLLALAADLFSDNVKKINAAIAEISTFGWLKAKGLIDESGIGYPADWDGDDPPFEGRLVCGGEDLAFDVKDGSGSGLRLLNESLSKVLAKAAVDASAQAPSLSVSVNAPSSQRWIGDNFRSIVEAFEEDLKNNGLADRILHFEAGPGRVTVGLNHSVGASIVGITEKASFLAAQVMSHAREKDKKLRHTDASLFLLIYIRLPHTGGADFDERTTPIAFDMLSDIAELPKALAGVLFVNFEFDRGKNSPDSILWDRTGGLAMYLGSAVNRVHVVSRISTPKQHQKMARAITPADIEASDLIAVGPCSLRGLECSARGAFEPLNVYYFGGEQFLACRECVKTFKWPTPDRQRCLEDPCEAPD